MDIGSNTLIDSGSYHKLPPEVNGVLCPSCMRFRRGILVPCLPAGWSEYSSIQHEHSKTCRKAKLLQKVKEERQLRLFAATLLKPTAGDEHTSEADSAKLRWTLRGRRASNNDVLEAARDAVSHAKSLQGAYEHMPTAMRKRDPIETDSTYFFREQDHAISRHPPHDAALSLRMCFTHNGSSQLVCECTLLGPGSESNRRRILVSQIAEEMRRRAHSKDGQLSGGETQADLLSAENLGMAAAKLLAAKRYGELPPNNEWCAQNATYDTEHVYS